VNRIVNRLQIIVEYRGEPRDLQHLQALLKELGRRHGLRCVSLQEVLARPHREILCKPPT
jgi:hypothetical protein